MDANLQPTLENDLIKIRPLEESDFEMLYEVAKDPKIWEQHPSPDRYKREVFETFFKGAMESKGAFLILNKNTNNPIGSSRYYNSDNENRSVSIGYTFLAADHWGTTYNRALKDLMLDHAFTFADNVIFDIGENNIRSQKAILKLGAKKTGEEKTGNTDEQKKLNYTYEIDAQTWAEIKKMSSPR